MASPAIDYDALAKQYGAVSSTSAGAAPVDYDALAKQHGATSSTSAAPSLLQDIGTSFQNFGRDVGSSVYGAAATANKIFANLSDIGENVVRSTVGNDAAAPLHNVGQTFRQNQLAQQTEAQRLAGGRNDLASQINRGLTQGVLELPQYAVAAHVAGPVAGMAAIGGISEADKGWWAAMQAAAEGALTGGALHVMGPASQALRAFGAAGMTYVQARLNGADPQTALTHATTMGIFAGHSPGGVTAREFVPGLDTAIKTGERVAEATGAGARAAGPDVGMGTAKAAGGYAAGELASMVPGGGFVRHVLDIPTALVGGRQIGRGLKKGYQAARTSWAETAPPEAPAASEPAAPGPAGAPTDDAILHLYSVETNPAKRETLRAELIDRGLMNDPNAPPAPGENPYRGYTQTALRNVYEIEPDPVKRTQIEEAAKGRGLSLLNREGRRATAAPPETGAPESRGPSLTQDDVLLLRFLGEENPEAADAETIGIARQLAADKPELLARLRSGTQPPEEAPVTTEEAAAPPVTSLGTLEYTAPGAAPAPAPAETPTPPPAPPPPAAPAPAPGKGNAAEIAAQLEASTRPDRMLDFLRRMDPEISADALDSIAPHEWAMVAEGAGSPRGTAPTAEDIATIRGNLGGITATEPAGAAAEFETKRAARTSRRKKTAEPAAPVVELQPGQTPAQALKDLMGPLPPLPAEGPAKPTASEERITTFAEHLAADQGINVEDLATVADNPAALKQMDELGRALGVSGSLAPGDIPQIVDRVRQLREGQGPAAPAEPAPGGEPPAPVGPQTLRDLMQPEAAAPAEAAFQAARESATPSAPAGIRDLFSRPDEVAAAAAERMRKRGSFSGRKLNAGIDPADLADMAVWGAAKIVKGVNDFSAWAKEMGQRFGNIDAPTLQKLWTESRMLFADQQAGSEVSTRIPTAVKATENPTANLLTTGYDTWRSQPQQFAKNAALLKTYPNFRDIKSVAPERITNTVLQRLVDNLLHLHDSMPEAIRGRARLWYDGANKMAHDFSGEYGATPEQSAGVLAVLSPQKDWFMNVDLAKRVLDSWRNRENLHWDPRMETTWNEKLAKSISDETARQRVWNDIQGKSFSELTNPRDRAIWFRLHDEATRTRNYPTVTPEGRFADLWRTKSGQPGNVAWGDYNSIQKAWSILDDGSRENISGMLGNEHKVRNFYNNIINPNSRNGHVTIDTHAVAASLLRALSGSSDEVTHNFGGGGAASSAVTGESGTYGLHAEAYRRAAALRGLLPREMQSITWEAIRGLFSPEFKRSPQLVSTINELWRDVSRGRISKEEAINRVWHIAEGIQDPTWSGTGSHSGAPPTLGR